jgi:hypothetical protein
MESNCQADNIQRRRKNNNSTHNPPKVRRPDMEADQIIPIHYLALMHRYDMASGPELVIQEVRDTIDIPSACAFRTVTYLAIKYPQVYKVTYAGSLRINPDYGSLLLEVPIDMAAIYKIAPCSAHRV